MIEGRASKVNGRLEAVVDGSWDLKEIINERGVNSLHRSTSQVVGDGEVLKVD